MVSMVWIEKRPISMRSTASLLYPRGPALSYPRIDSPHKLAAKTMWFCQIIIADTSLKQLALIQNNSCNTVKNNNKKRKLCKAGVTKTNSKIGKKAQKVVKSCKMFDNLEWWQKGTL